MNRLSQLPKILCVPLWIAFFSVVQPAFGIAAEKISFALDWKIYGAHAPFLLAKERGYYRDEGLDVEITEGQGAATLAKLLAQGSTEFGFLDYGTMIKGVSQGMPLKAVFGVFQTSPMIIISDAANPVKKPSDLEGRLIAMSPAESTAQIFPAFLAANKLEKKKINIVSPAVGAKSSLLLQKRVDAITAFVNVQVAQLEAQGAKIEYIRFADFNSNTLSIGVVANRPFLEKNPETAKRFIRATQKGWKDAMKEPGAAIDATLKNFPQYKSQRAVLLRQLQLTFPLLATPNTKGKPLGWMSQEDWESTQNIMRKHVGVETTDPAASYFTNDLIQ